MGRCRPARIDLPPENHARHLGLVRSREDDAKALGAPTDVGNLESVELGAPHIQNDHPSSPLIRSPRRFSEARGLRTGLKSLRSTIHRQRLRMPPRLWNTGESE